MVSVFGLMRPVKQRGEERAEELAARIAAGDSVQPDEIVAVLDRCRISGEDLQAAVDRHARVIELRRQMEGADKMQARFDAIESEVHAAEAAVAAARGKLQSIVDSLGEEHMTLKHRLDAVERARRSLLAEENLTPAQAERLRAARDAASRASDDLEAQRRELTDRQSRLRKAEEELPKAEHAAKVSPRSVDARDAAERLRNAVKARGELVAEAVKAVAAAETAAEDAAAECRSVEAAIAKAVSESAVPPRKK